MIGYADLKEMAKATGTKVGDLIVLASGNDPFYAGMPNRQEKAEWLAELWQELGVTRFAAVHLRRVHYWLISHQRTVLKPDGEPYRNTQRDWQFLVSATLAARYLGMVPTEVFVDRRNPEPQVYAPNPCWPHIHIDSHVDAFGDLLPETLEPPEAVIRDMRPDQPNLVELWVEKATVNDVLEPIAKRYGSNLVVGVGEESETACRMAIERAQNAGKPMRILYISDFDPGGRSMPVGVARKIEFWVRKLNLDVEITLEPIALLPEQVEQYNLPREPIEKSERRGKRFEERFGEGSVELDALEAIHPGELGRIAEKAVTRYIDPYLSNKTEAAEQRIDSMLKAARDEVIERHRPDLDEVRREYERLRSGLVELEGKADQLWHRIADEIQSEAPEITADLFPQPEHQVPEAPLFDSRRRYLEQLAHYEAWKNPGDD